LDTYGITTSDRVTCGMCGSANFGVKLALDSIILVCNECEAEARLRPEVALAYWWSCWQKSRELTR
jgi:hypothetical protein